ncbi:magnesium transporter CorA family protein [Mobilitalea sibirica]|uniref:Magnesium transporter CorA family protein n=1 Tax=Mobilitalea sibirica TaxID=1462919 RepID=A0A8J7KV28_9FIRM|nr:magnesium transporter CorA family protein [Mobilitalea sibirica]MBH1939685.1 magnesium transporter CorA family protein [Mobilitalea sibirica]
MIEIYKTTDGSLQRMTEITEGCWITMTNPSATELLEISEKTNIDINNLRAPLDEEERARIEVEDNHTLILVDIPTLERRNDKDRYVTIPLGIIVANEFIITVCLEDTPILKCFIDGRVRDFYTFKKTRFIIQILYRNASTFLQHLRTIDRKSEEIERKLHISSQNRELIELLELEKSLVYFTTSLRSNEVVFEKMLKNENIKRYPEDEDLLEDLIIENKQAIEMASIYSGILSGTMDAFASIISNNLNIVMKFLAAITIVLSIPTMIASFYGMNFINIPGGNNYYGFYIVTCISLLLTGITVFIFRKKKLF